MHIQRPRQAPTGSTRESRRRNSRQAERLVDERVTGIVVATVGALNSSTEEEEPY
jgi:hypothetical protein